MIIAYLKNIGGIKVLKNTFYKLELFHGPHFLLNYKYSNSNFLLNYKYSNSLNCLHLLIIGYQHIKLRI